jgi:hypothetical protein
MGISRSCVCVQQHGVGIDSYKPWQSDTDLAGREVLLSASRALLWRFVIEDSTPLLKPPKLRLRQAVQSQVSK